MRCPALAGLLIAAATAGCYELRRHVPALVGDPLPQPRAFRDGSVDYGFVRRVLALPLSDESGNGAGTEVVSRALRDEIAKLRRFDLVAPSASDAALAQDDGPLQTGRIPVATIIELGRRYHVDAVLFGSITHYRPYQPAALGMSVSLIDVQTGKIVWSVNDLVDSADRAAALAMNNDYFDRSATDQTVFGREIMNASPEWFARFTARRIAGTLVPTSSAP